MNRDNYENIASRYTQIPVLQDHIKWVISHPQFQSQYLFGIKDSSSKKVLLITYSVCCNIIIGGKVLSSLLVTMAINRSAFPRSYTEDVEVKFLIASCRRIMNDVKLFGISQVIIKSNQFGVLQPLLSNDIRICPLPKHSL